jgi:hypothetical protein
MDCLGYLKVWEYKAQWWLAKLDHLSLGNKKKRVSKEEELRDELNKLRIKLSNKKS